MHLRRINSTCMHIMYIKHHSLAGAVEVWSELASKAQRRRATCRLHNAHAHAHTHTHTHTHNHFIYIIHTHIIYYIPRYILYSISVYTSHKYNILHSPTKNSNLSGLCLQQSIIMWL